MNRISVCKNKVLYISLCAPYDGVAHAGGKTHNYYLKELAKNFDVKLVTFVKEDEFAKMDLDLYKIDHRYIYLPTSFIGKLLRILLNIESKINPYNRYGGFVSNFHERALIKVLRELSAMNYQPDLILLEWTQILFFLPLIRQFYDRTPVFTIEVDVAFLGVERLAKACHGILKKRFAWIRANKVKKIELRNLSLVDKIFVNNIKDQTLLEGNGIDHSKIDILTPYYDVYSECKYNPDSKNILFFGAMSRPENWKTALWFIDNVMPLLDESFTYTVVGNHPPKQLLVRKNSRIIITGFVDKVNPYFENSLCFVSPLVLGAGVKVKIMEAMTSGIPVICNQVSIEGIKALNGREYIHCETAEEFAREIKKISEDKKLAIAIGNNGRNMILKNYSYKQDSEKLESYIKLYTVNAQEASFDEYK